MRQANPSKLWKLRKNLEDIRELIKDGDTILDVGCGRGVFYEVLGRPAGYCGIDIDAGEIEKAKETWPEAKFELKDLYDIKGRWDVVICSRVLIHHPDFEAAMKVLLGCAKRCCVIVVWVGADSAKDEGGVWFRTFSETTLRSAGDCRIITHHDRYTTVIYGPW